MFNKSPDLVTCLRKRQNFVSLRTSTPLKQRVSSIGCGSALPPPVNTVSIPVASLASLPQPMKSSTTPASSQAPGESAFKGQLQDAIKEKKGRSGTKDPKQGDAGKKEIPKPPILVAAVAPTPPPPPAGSIGLPSAGVEAGSNTEGASIKTSAVEQTPIDTPTPDINPPMPPTETVQPDPSTGLAFALRLADLTPNRVAPLPTTVPPDVRADLAFAPPRAETPQQPVIGPSQAVLSAPALSQRTTEASLAAPVKALLSALQPAAAAPVIAIAPPRDGAASESGSHSSDGGDSSKESPKRLQPAADPKSFQQASTTSEEAASSLSKVTPLQTLSPTLAPPTSAPPPASGTVTTAIPIERVSVPLPAPNPASHVTDVSVNLQVPRADASGDDRVAIRMLQVGSEIHVSVRTPDSQLAQSLRQDLGKLTTGLDQGGFRTETWRPVAANAAAQSNTNPQHQPSQDNPNRDGAGSNAGSAGNSGQGAGEQNRKEQDDRPRWVAELEQQKNQ